MPGKFSRGSGIKSSDSNYPQQPWNKSTVKPLIAVYVKNKMKTEAKKTTEDLL